MSSKFKGAYLPSTQVWDTSEVESAEGVNDPTKELVIRMYQKLADMATMINYKETGLYPTQEFVCSKKYFANETLTSTSGRTPKLREVIRKTLPWLDEVTGTSALPNAALGNMKHVLTFDANTVLVGLTAACTDPTHRVYMTLPYVSCAKGTIAIWANATDVFIECCGFDGTDFTINNIVIEYIKF